MSLRRDLVSTGEEARVEDLAKWVVENRERVVGIEKVKGERQRKVIE